MPFNDVLLATVPAPLEEPDNEYPCSREGHGHGWSIWLGFD